MRTSTMLISALVGIGSALASSNSLTQLTTCTPHPGAVSPQQQRVIFEKFADLVYHNATAASIAEAYKHVRADEVQHNPDNLDGAAASFAVFNAVYANRTNVIQVLHQAFEAPIGWVHFRIDGASPEPAAIVDMYRFNGSCIVEHWDVIQERPVNATNPHALF
ncbi:hypothetical protein B0H14DRAFT_3136163 [Mycena olivaceomarginata]|nr:hypothetical protein B0H14DRAFT_2464666 [Mycena olivaceomarginata]KAJ7823231.1 hypothetical protein B0H14DRAFT_2454439 [Mycena olivaceomarginata]KAJ7856123.1 hypothetical protein B0H14DRAFT_3136163 [Mycena olivaceomarginata]